MKKLTLASIALTALALGACDQTSSGTEDTTAAAETAEIELEAAEQEVVEVEVETVIPEASGLTLADLDTADKKAAYAVGFSYGQYSKQGAERLDSDIIIAGFIAGMNEDMSVMSVEDAQTEIRVYQLAERQRIQAEREAEMAKNLAEAEAFLAENASKDGVITTESGLQYKVIEMGTGPKPTTESRVKVHYRGTLLDGKVFDSSIDRGQPAIFGVGQVIRGWTEGLQIMPVGSKFQFFIHPNLAYGERSTGMIKGNSLLTFDVELIEIVTP